jgi:hypothetical protein
MKASFLPVIFRNAPAGEMNSANVPPRFVGHILRQFVLPPLDSLNIRCEGEGANQTKRPSRNMPSAIRVLVQDRESGFYLQRPRDWTAEIDEATDFEEIVAAFDWATQFRQKALDIVMTYGQPDHDVRIPVPR